MRVALWMIAVLMVACGSSEEVADIAPAERMKAPLRGFVNSSAIYSMVKWAFDRAAIHPAQKGPHILRHSLATNMLRKGASLGEIGEILRHRDLSTTQIYAKVDMEALRRIAQPWPGGEE